MAPRSASSERRTSSVCATQLSACLIWATLIYVTAALRSKATPMAARPAFRRAGIAACISYPPPPAIARSPPPGAALYVRSILLPCSRGVMREKPDTTTPALRATPPEDRREKIPTSPDLRAVLGSAPHRVAFPDAESVVERLQVHQ